MLSLFGNHASGGTVCQHPGPKFLLLREPILFGKQLHEQQGSGRGNSDDTGQQESKPRTRSGPLHLLHELEFASEGRPERRG